MELKSQGNRSLLLMIALIVFAIILGSWWLFLLHKLSGELPLSHGRYAQMIFWEGLVFFITLGILSLVLVFRYREDERRSKAVNAFFASITHELKTPLASLHLQAEALQELLIPEKLEKRDRIFLLLQRLFNETRNVEEEFDKVLGLARIEREAKSYLTSLDIHAFLLDLGARYNQELSITIQSNGPYLVLADEVALKIIFSNLFQNTLKHTNSRKVLIGIKDSGHFIAVAYEDFGPAFTGKIQHIAELFYKHQSPKGSGIGLYLSKKLTRTMGGEFRIETTPSLKFQLKFKKAVGA